MNTWYKHFSSQVHQSFFTSGIFFLLLFLLLLSFIYLGQISLDTSHLTFHAYTFIFVVFLQFFLGFLFTVFPKFLQQVPIDKNIYMKHFLFYFCISIFIFSSIVFYSKILFIFQILYLFIQISSFKLLYSYHKKSQSPSKEDTKWILIGFFWGIIAHFLFIVSGFEFAYSYELSKLSINMGFYLFLFMVVFSVSQRMIPFFTRSIIPSYMINKSKNLLFLIHLFLVLKVILLNFDNKTLYLLSDVPLLFIFIKEFIKWKLPIFKVPSIMWVLHLALFWIPIGFSLSIFEALSYFFELNIIFEKVVLHTFAVGYFLTVLFGFGTRVILGHSGASIFVGKFASSIFIAVSIFTFIRIFNSFALNFELDYSFFVSLSSLLLVLVVLLWSFKYLKILLVPQKTSWEIKK